MLLFGVWTYLGGYEQYEVVNVNLAVGGPTVCCLTIMI